MCPSASAPPRRREKRSMRWAARSSAHCNRSSLISCNSSCTDGAVMRDPDFWWRRPSLATALLAPVAAGYGAVAAARMRKSGARAGVAVLCVGNFTLGGAGKTPTAIALARMLTDTGESVFCLSRGYGGNIAGVKLVDPHSHTAAQV